MNTLSIRIGYRPLKIGWCLNTGDMTSLEKAIRLTNTMWGGRYNPIIPVDQVKLAKQLISLFKVDILFPVSQDEEVDKFIEQFSYLPNPFFEPELFIKSSSSEVIAQILDLYHPIRHLYEKHIKNNPSPKFKATLYEWNEKDPLGIIYLATFGGFPSKEETGFDYFGLIEENLIAERISLISQGKVPKDFFKKATPNRISCYKLKLTPLGLNPWNSPGFYVGSVMHFNDLMHFWNLRAANIELIFYDPIYKKRLDEVRAEYLAALSQRPQRHELYDTRAAIWHIRTENEIDLAGFDKDMVEYKIDLALWNGLNVKAPSVGFGDKSVLANVGTSSNKTTISFSLPEKPCFTNGHRNFQHLVATISYGIGLYGNERETLYTPFLPQLNEFYGRNHYFIWNQARVEQGGMGIIIDAFNDDLTLSALEVNGLISKIFEIVGINSQTSQAGLIASRLIQQLDGLQGCRVFKIKGARELINKYRPDQSFTRSAALQIIGQVDPKIGKTNFSEYEKLFIEARKGRIKQKPEDALNFLIKKDIFRVGLNLKCPKCILEFWLALDNIKTKTKCIYCGEEFNITQQLKDRDWRFRRSGLFGKENNQEGAIPVVLTLQQMHTVFSHDGMLYNTSMKLTPKNASIKPCETDFVILTKQNINHEVQIAIGECKNKKEITEDDVSKMRMVAESLEEFGINTFVIFSKLTDFSPDELKCCLKVNEKYRNRLILFTKRELEPYFLYEKTAKQFDVKRHVHSFSDMVKVTHRVFYEKLVRLNNNKKK